MNAAVPALLLTLLVVPAGSAAWGPGGCPPVGGHPVFFQAPPPAPDHITPYEWRGFASDPCEFALYKGGLQRGGWRSDTGVFRPFDPHARVWGAPCDPPYPPPALAKKAGCECTEKCPCDEGSCPCKLGKDPCSGGCRCLVAQAPPPEAPGAEEKGKNFGVDVDKLSKDGARHYYKNGREVSRQAAWDAVGKKGLVDDTDKVRLTVIGPEAERKKVLDDLKSSPELAPYRDALLVQAYPPDSWVVRDKGFVASGAPTIYLQKADGTVLHRQDDYAGGPSRLSQAVRRAVPDYDPKKDPDLTKSQPSPLPALPWYVWAGGALILVLFASGKR